MFREIAQILLAINLSSTHTIPQVREATLANTIQTCAQDNDTDPFIVIAIVAHESQWREGAISGDGEDYGLMQTRARYYNGGKHSNWLLDGVTNIKYGTYLIKQNKDLCRKFLHREPKTQEWLACYQGSCGNGGMCKPTRLTKKVEDFSLCLQSNLEDGHNYNCKGIYWPEIKATEGQEKYHE